MGGIGPIEVSLKITTIKDNIINFDQTLSFSTHSFLLNDVLGTQDRPRTGTFTVKDDDGASIRVEGTFDSGCNFNVDSASPPLSSSSSIRTSQTSIQGATITSSTATTVSTKDSTSSSVDTSVTSRSGTQTQQSISSYEPQDTASSDSQTSSSGTSGRADHHLTAGVIIGIVIGVIAAVLLAILLALCIFRRRRRRIKLSSELLAVPWAASSPATTGVESSADLPKTPHSLTTEPPQPLTRTKETWSDGATLQSPPKRATRNSRSLPPLPPSPPRSAIPSPPQTSLPLYYPQQGNSGSESERDVVLHLQRQVDMLISENARLADQLPHPPAYRQNSSQES